MKKFSYWVTIVGAFFLGYLTNGYLYQQQEQPEKIIGYPLQPENINNTSQEINTSKQTPTNNPSQKYPTEFSWNHLRQLTDHQEYDKAITLLKEYLQTHPDDAQAWYWLASCYQSMGRLALAVESSLEYLTRERDADNAQNAIDNLKRLLQQLGKNQPADQIEWHIEQINKLLDISINDGQLHLMLAQLYLDTHDEYQAQYHALMAANQLDTASQAEKILAQLNGDIADEPMQISLTRYGEQFIVTVYIENTPANLLLDTGASISGVTSRYVAKYPFMVKNSKPIQLNTASGTKESYLFTVDNLQMGNTRFAQHMLAVLPMNELTEFDGLLGVDILGKFDFVIDQNNSVLKLNPRKP